MTKKFLQFAVALSAVAAVPAVHAQDASVLSVGTRVKLVTSALEPSQQTGTIVSATRDTITFRADANPVTRSLAVSDISSIQISGGMQTHRGRDALIGLVIGSGAGAAIGKLTRKKSDCAASSFCLDLSRGNDVIGGAILGGLTGTLIGAFVFGSRDKTERWIPLRRSATVSFLPTADGLQLRVAHSF